MFLLHRNYLKASIAHCDFYGTFLGHPVQHSFLQLSLYLAPTMLSLSVSAELRFVTTVATGGRVKFVPAV